MNKKILIIKPSGIGDIVHSLPVAIGLKLIYPYCKIHWLVFNKFKDILYGLDYIDEIILWNRNGGLKEYIRLIEELKKQNYDLIIDLQVLFRTALLGYLLKFKKIISTGYVREFSNFFVSPVAKFDKNLHAVERNYQVVEFLAKKENKSVPKPIDLLPWIKINKNEDEYAKKLLEFDSNKKYIFFSVGSRGQHKIWPKENFLELINLLYKKFKNLFLVFVGSKEEIDRVNWVISNLHLKEYKNFVGYTDLHQLCALLNNAAVVVSNDSGVAHISAALDRPTLVLFGPSDPTWFYPYNMKSGYIYKNLKCSPCGIKTLCKNNRCMQEITPKEVFEYIDTNFSSYLL